MKILALAVTAAVLFAAAPAAFAQPSGEATAVAVRHSDLDLNDPAQAGVMLDRIGRAALQACGAADTSVSEYQAAVRASACYREGVRDAVAQLNAPALTALYRQRYTA